MNFDSHMSSVVLGAVAVINELTPGLRGGREWTVPEGTALLEALDRALPPAWADEHRDELAQEQARALVPWATRLRAVIELVDAGELDTACQELNAIMREAGAVPTLARHDGEPWHLHFHEPDADWATSWAASMATGLAIVLGNPAVDRLGVCHAPACDRVYLDVSRNGTKRFCSTACQNRVKAASFRARRRGR